MRCLVPALLSATLALAQESDDDLVWRTPSQDASGSMPIGNGRLGANVWFTADGVLHCLLSRTDSFSEASRLLKLGRVDVAVRRPVDDEFFEQRLCPRAGCIRVTLGDGERKLVLTLFVDSEDDVIHVVGEGARPEVAVISGHTWRTAVRRLEGSELQSSWTMKDAPADVVVAESADRAIMAEAPLRLGFCHRNETSAVAFTLLRQGLEPVGQDLLLHRTFGLLFAGTLAGRGHMLSGLAPVALSDRAATFALQIAAPCLPASDADAWRTHACTLLALADPQVARARTAAWWQAFWERSFVRVSGDPAAEVHGAAQGGRLDPTPRSRLTQALVLQRWVAACGGRGAFPIKFNGSIFTVEPRFTGGPDHDADWRKWGDCFWWQNTRLPYHPMLAQGDLDLQEPLFRLYRDTLPLARQRVQRWHGGAVKGAYWPETMTPFGSHANGDYGWERKDLPASKVLCPWWEYARNQGLELVALMLERFDHERDAEFVKQQLLEVAVPVLEYFATAYPRGQDGRLRITPTQALETHWHQVENDLPTVAGLHEVLASLLRLPAPLLASAPVDDWRALQAALPEVPVRTQDGVAMLAPAAAYEPSRQNCESPELYAVFPFRLFGLDKPRLELALAAFAHRHDRLTNGWPQDGQDAALLGLVDEAQKNLLAKLQNGNRGHRFPAFWGPNFDWCPDQCHGSNLLDTCQRMLLQCDGDRIVVLPCWPAAWDVHFRLHAPQRTVVEVDYRSGRIARLLVTPGSRSKDVVDGSARGSKVK